MQSTALPGILVGSTSTTIRLSGSSSGRTLVEGQTQNSGGIPLNEALPPLLKILAFYVDGVEGENGMRKFFTSAFAFNDVQFTGQRPIVGVGTHFAVYASPFHASETNLPVRVRESGAEVYCIKSPNPSSMNSKNFRNEYYNAVLKELRVTTLMDDENIISLFGIDWQEDYDDFKVAWPMLLMEFAEFGTLDTFQQDLNGFQPPLARRLLLDVALGLSSLHRCNIIHGDVKSENILVCRHQTRHYVAKLSDFGLSVIHPAIGKNHYLPGCTWLWSAPEARDQLSVSGLQLTDVFSFGLTAWRVLLNCGNPFDFVQTQSTGDGDSIAQLKASPTFPQLVAQTIQVFHNGSLDVDFATSVVSSTLSPDPTQRSLEAAILSLSEGRINQDVIEDTFTPPSADRESPQRVLETLADAFPHGYSSLIGRQAVLYSLFQDLEILIQSDSVVSLLSATLYFEFATSPTFQVGDKSIDQCCRLLFQLCELGSPVHRSIVQEYCKMNQRRLPETFDSAWLEDGARRGSYFATKSLSAEFPERYLQWKATLEREASSASIGSPEDHQRLLVTYCRTGDFERCEALLDAGTSAIPFDWDEPSALHWLALSSDPQTPALAARLIDAGAVLDHWEGEESDDVCLFGKFSGTPLHWSIWHRNLPLVRMITARDPAPEERNVRRAVMIAATMYFCDELEILRAWIASRNPRMLSDDDLLAAISAASTSSLYHIPRLLRHGEDDTVSVSKTFDVLFQMYIPTPEELAKLLTVVVVSNNPYLFRNLVNRFEVVRKKLVSQDTFESCYCIAITCGFVEIFDAFFECGIFRPDHLFLSSKFTGLQSCCAVRQRNLHFMKRYLEWGCPVDGLGGTETAEWTPFTMCVSAGLYESANLLLHHGADKDFPTGWVGGTTPAFRLICQWPDLPISRLKYLLEELPRQGFGHVSFIGWPAAGGNLLYAFPMAAWSHYRSSYRFGETMQYLLGMMADKRCLNEIDRMGCTALNMASRTGNLEVCRTLIEAGADVNGGLGIAPLDAAQKWLAQWQKEEIDAINSPTVGRMRHAIRIRKRAEETVQLLVFHGAVGRNFLQNQQMMLSTIASGNFRLPSAEFLLECLSGLIDNSSTVNPATMRIHPTRTNDFIIYKGGKTAAQSILGKFGRLVDRSFQGLGDMASGRSPFATSSHGWTLAARYQPHNCYPWLLCPFRDGGVPHTDLTTYGGPHSTPSSPPIHSPQDNSSAPVSHSLHLPGLGQPSPAQSVSHHRISANRATAAKHPMSPHESMATRPPFRSTSDIIQRIQAGVNSLRNQADENDLYSSQRVESFPHDVLQLLEIELAGPIMLSERATTVEECTDFAIIVSAIEATLGAVAMRRVGLTPVLAEDGSEMTVLVRLAEGE